MKNKLKICSVLIALVGLVLSAFFVNLVSAKELDLEKAKSPFTFQEFSNGFTNGIPAEIKIPKDSKAEKEIFNWLRSNSTGWKITFLDFAPGKIIRGQNININFLKDGVILNFSPNITSSRWMEYSKPISKNDLEFLNKLTKELGS